MSQVETFDYAVNLLRNVLLWPFNDAENLQGLLTAKQQWYDVNQTQFWENWVTDVFDLRTANDFGLSVWAVILDLPLFGNSDVSPATYPAFGFDTGEGFPATSPITNFGNGNFATDASTAFGIPTEQKRILLRLRYFQLITRGAIPETNRFLRTVFGPNQIYALDGLDMTMTYVIVGATAQNLVSLLQLFDVLPRPAGVDVDFVTAGIEGFGFDPTGLNFNNGSFIAQ